jgi:hypothetical protein
VSWNNVLWNIDGNCLNGNAGYDGGKLATVEMANSGSNIFLDLLSFRTSIYVYVDVLCVAYRVELLEIVYGRLSKEIYILMFV